MQQNQATQPVMITHIKPNRIPRPPEASARIHGSTVTARWVEVFRAYVILECAGLKAAKLDLVQIRCCHSGYFLCWAGRFIQTF